MTLDPNTTPVAGELYRYPSGIEILIVKRTPKTITWCYPRNPTKTYRAGIARGERDLKFGDLRHVNRA